jgi:uncharacterized membrane protein
MEKDLKNANPVSATDAKNYYYRFHLPHLHLGPVFGNDWFALKAEAFARFFGTPIFLVSQTLIVVVWIGLNVAGYTKFDVYPFILLNLAFSLQAAYAAPLILLAQTRQAGQIMELLQQNTQLTELVKELSQRIEVLTLEMHDKVVVHNSHPSSQKNN